GGLLEETSQPAGWDHYQDNVQQPYRFLRNDLAQGLAALPGPGSFTEVATALLAALQKERDPQLCKALAEAVAAGARRLDPPVAAKVCKDAAQRLSRMQRSDAWTGNSRATLAEGIAALAGQLEAAAAEEVCAELAELLRDDLARAVRMEADAVGHLVD